MDDMLDLDAVRAFVQVADLLSFTRAADALDTTQSAVSLKIKRLEASLGKPLLERTPRSVRLSPAGTVFLEAARELLDANRRAFAALGAPRQRLRLGLSEHVAGGALPRLLANLYRHDPQLVLEMRVGLSAELLAAYDERQYDAVIVRYEAGEAPGWSHRADATLLFDEPLVWLAAPEWRPAPELPLPVASLAAPCAVRSAALRALDEARVAWREVFVGGGIGAVGAAVASGIAVAALARRVAPPGLVELDGRHGMPAFPALPASQVVMHTRAREPRAAAALRQIAASLAAH